MRARLKAIDAWVCGTAAATALGLAATGCAAMRSHGVPAFPDPGPNGGTVQRMPPTVDTHSPAFATAQQKCRKLVPGLFGAQGAAAP